MKFQFAPLLIILGCIVGLTGPSDAQENKNLNSGPDQLEACDFVDFGFKDAAKSDGGNIPVPLTAANFVQIGSPSGGYPSITSMVAFNSKLFLSTSKFPLGDWGTNVFYTTNGINYTKVLEDATSQGYLRIRSFDGKLWIPDGDPNGLDPSFVYTSSTGSAGSFAKGNVLAAVHTFDVVKYNNKFYCSNGMGNGRGGLCEFNGSNQWSSVYENSNSMRMKYMTVLNGKLIVANKLSSSDVDCFVWNGGDVATTNPTQVNALSGATNTYRLFTSSVGKAFWSVSSTQPHVLVSTDGVSWQTATTLDGRLVADFAELNGKIYALAWDGLWESSDYFTFQKIASVPQADTTAFMPAASGPGFNPDASASMEVYNGSLWCGSSRNGKIYRVDFTTSIPEYQDYQFEAIYPNPVFNSATFQTKTTVVNGTLIIYNAYGQIVKQIKDINGNSFMFNRENLAAGLYYVQLRENNAIVASGKLIIAD